MQTPLSVKGITKANVAIARASGTYPPGITSGTHRKAIIAPTPVIANHDAWRANSTPHPFGNVAGRFAVDLHRSASKSEHSKRNGSKCKMIVQHDAEETSYQYLVGQSSGGQYKNCEIMAA